MLCRRVCVCVCVCVWSPAQCGWRNLLSSCQRNSRCSSALHRDAAPEVVDLRDALFPICLIGQQASWAVGLCDAQRVFPVRRDREHGGLDAAGGGTVSGGCSWATGSRQTAVLQRWAGAHGEEAIIVVTQRWSTILPTSLQPSSEWASPRLGHLPQSGWATCDGGATGSNHGYHSLLLEAKSAGGGAWGERMCLRVGVWNSVREDVCGPCAAGGDRLFLGLITAAAPCVWRRTVETIWSRRETTLFWHLHVICFTCRTNRTRRQRRIKKDLQNVTASARIKKCQVWLWHFIISVI